MILLKQKIEWAVIRKTALVVSIALMFGVSFWYLQKALLGAADQEDSVLSFGKQFDRQMAEGVRAVQPWSGQVVAFKSCRVTKPKLGGFRLGAFNVLEIDELEITWPCVPMETTAFSASFAGNVTERISHSLDADGLSAVAGLGQRVSAVSVRGFRLFMSCGQQRIPVVVAETAKSGGMRSITLENCELLTEQLEYIRVPMAKLRMGESVMIETAAQQVNLDNLSKIIEDKQNHRLSHHVDF